MVGGDNVLHCIETGLQNLELAVDSLLGRLLLVHPLFLRVYYRTEFGKRASSGVNLEVGSFAFVETPQRGARTRYTDSRTYISPMLISVPVMYERAAQVTVDLSVRALNLPVTLEFGFGHLLMTALAADSVMQTSLLVVLPLNRLSAIRVLAFHHRVTTINGNMVLHLSTLDLRFAAIFAFRTLDYQVVQDVD